jgi:hypothetical protein
MGPRRTTYENPTRENLSRADPSRTDPSRTDPSRADPSRDSTDHGGRITVVEVIGFTATLAFIAAFASGAFDAMVPWR